MNEKQIIDKVSMIDQWKVSGDLPAFLELEELQAINEKCKELGWV